MPVDRRDFMLFSAGVAAGAVPATALAEWRNRENGNGARFDLRETGAAFDDLADDTEPLQEGIRWIANRDGGRCLLPQGTARVTTLELPASVVIEGAGGNSGASTLRGIALQGPVVRIRGRSAGLRGLAIAATPERLGSRTPGLFAHGIHIAQDDVPMARAEASMSRLRLDDISIVNQPLDGLHVSGPIELSRFDTVTVADCRRHGFALDDGGRAGYTNRFRAFFMLQLAACRAIECGGNALLAGKPRQRFQPHNLILDHFEALGCCWSESVREIAQQIGLYNQQTLLRQPDIEDQQFDASRTRATGMARTARDAPAEGILCASQGVDMQQPYFSSLAKSVTVNPRAGNIRITQPKIYPGRYGRPQPVAVTVGRNVRGFELAATKQPGAAEMVRNESVGGVIRVD